MHLVSFMCFILFVLIIFTTSVTSHAEHPLLLLVSFDGFRWDYLMKAKLANHSTPNFDSLIKTGVTLDEPGLLNSFTTQTFPNHYTLVTGMFEENHGVVANEMFDPSVNKTFERSSDDVKDPFWFNNGTQSSDSDHEYRGPQPIWNVNQMHGSGPFERRSGVMFWPGSEAAIGGTHPHHCQHYDSSVPNKTRINNVVDWFSTEVNPINLGLLYFSEPDHSGHRIGPDDPQMMQLIEELDGLVGYLIIQLKAVNLFEKMNIIITSDHGMAKVKKKVEVTVDESLYDVYGRHSPVWSVYPKPGKTEIVYNEFKKLEHVHVYKRENIPRSYHYTYNKRISPILVVAEEGYIMCLNSTPCSVGGGIHGYNNSLKSMHPFFIAHGPAFKKNYVGKPFRNVDVYPLMCHVLKIDIPFNIDGSLLNVQNILFTDDFVFEVTAITFLLSVAFTALVAGVCCISACRIYRIQIHKRNKRCVIVEMNKVVADVGKPLLNSSDDEFS